MKTLKRGLFLRLVSVVMTLMMLFSLVSVGIVSASAAEVDLAETGFSGGFNGFRLPCGVGNAALGSNFIY